jgi:paraquat-inducible protein B
MTDLETAVVNQKRGISRIWIVPLIAIAIGAWMIYKFLDEQGAVIHISMPNADGVIAGKTLIKTRSVPIGVVTEVRLAEKRWSG